MILKCDTIRCLLRIVCSSHTRNGSVLNRTGHNDYQKKKICVLGTKRNPIRTSKTLFKWKKEDIKQALVGKAVYLGTM